MASMDQLEELYFNHRWEWRTWLEQHYKQTAPVWLIYFKKTSGKTSLSYNDSVEQALCFGWIDGIIKSVDEESYKRKFMPRTNFYNWSPSNRVRVAKLIESQEMTEIGLCAIGNYAKTRQLIWPLVDDTTFDNFSADLLNILKANDKAFQFFNSLSKSHQNRYIQWVMHAKKEETRIKRMKEAITLLQNSTKNLLK